MSGFSTPPPKTRPPQLWPSASEDEPIWTPAFLQSMHDLLASSLIPAPMLLPLDEKEQDLPSRLSIITFNVWFDRQDWCARSRSLISSLLLVSPPGGVSRPADVVCLQEVVPALHAALLDPRSPLLSLYHVSTVPVGSYGVVTLVLRSSVADGSQPVFTSFPLRCSDMGRSLLIASFPLREQCPTTHTPLSAHIGNVHLESLSARSLRRLQLQVCHQALGEAAAGGKEEGDSASRLLAGLPRSLEEKAPPTKRTLAALCGDFNFDDRQEWGSWRTSTGSCFSLKGAGGLAPLENAVLQETMPLYVDCWCAVRGDEAGPTFDGGRNPYVRDRDEVMRYDRILAMSETLSPTCAELLFSDPPISDHYALKVTFTCVGGGL